MDTFFKCLCGKVVEVDTPDYEQYIADGKLHCLKCKDKFLYKLGLFLFSVKKRRAKFGRDKRF